MEGHVPAINIEHYLKSRRPKHTIRAKQYEDFVAKNNIENSVCNNSKCFKPVIAKTENYRNSFFVRTVYDRNKLSEDIVTCDSLETFKTLLLARLHEVQKSYCSHPGRTRSHSRSRSTLLKFSRSLYLCNHSSESIHTWTIGTQ